MFNKCSLSHIFLITLKFCNLLLIVLKLFKCYFLTLFYNVYFQNSNALGALARKLDNIQKLVQENLTDQVFIIFTVE